MSKEDTMQLDGTVIETLPNALFRVRLDSDTGQKIEVMATISGKMRKNNIRVLLGDKVSLDVSPYDTTKGRITYRFK